MTSVDQITAKGQEALRRAILMELTGAQNEEALLKEHYDSLQELTNISKKTLKRFFKEKMQVGPQTRNLLAAVALGKKNELGAISEQQQDYYLTFLESLNLDFQTSIEENEPVGSIWQFGKIMANHYLSNRSTPFFGNGEYISLMCRRKRTEPIEGISENRSQEVQLNRELLVPHQQCLIIGEAGVGKTMYAHHLCLHWAEFQTPDQGIPIYLDLKSNHFSRHNRGILTYLLSEYFGRDLDWMVLDFLERNTDSYFFIVDGLDDLSANEKKLVINELKSFSDQVAYLILSRPYGFQDFEFPTRSLYEIIGLDLHAQEAYVRQYLPEYEEALKVSSLMAYIHGHPVLSTLSRSPMCLSQIMALAATANNFELLENIKTGIDLHQAYYEHVSSDRP